MIGNIVVYFVRKNTRSEKKVSSLSEDGTFQRHD
jgi:hypothetical protein